MDRPRAMMARDPVQALAALVGATFLIVGIAGFIPGITSHLYGGLDFAGHNSQAKVLHLFQTSWLHNIVHLAFGVAGLTLARTWEGARTYLIGGGVIYLALWLLGIVGGGDWIPVDTADNWLHFVLGLGMIGLGFVTARERVAAPRTT